MVGGWVFCVAGVKLSEVGWAWEWCRGFGMAAEEESEVRGGLDYGNFWR